MTPWEKAAQWQQDHCPDERLIEAVSKCIVGGLVHSSADLFVLGWEAHWDEEQKQFTEGEPNAWVCKLAAGHNVITGGMRIAPRKHKWLVWQRNNDGRWRAHHWDKLIKRFNK
jgi:hypothetical protein